MPIAIAQQENKNAWVWSVNTRDQNNQHQEFYLTTENVIVNWTIDSSGQDAIINDAYLKTYPLRDKMYDGRPYWVPPKKSTSLYKNETTIQLDTGQTEEHERTDLVEITAYAAIKDNTLMNETHIIEVKVKQPGNLEIHKVVPDGSEDLLSGWKFTILETGQSGLTNNKGIVSFRDLRPGMYNITEEIRSGWVRTYPNEEMMPVEIKPGKTEPVVYKNKPNTLTITKKDSEERPLSDWVFNLIGLEGQPAVPSEKTVDGKAVFQGFASGKYRIEETPKDGWRFLSITSQTPNKAVSSNGEVGFGSGESVDVVAVNAKTGAFKIPKKDSEGRPLPGWTFTIDGPDRIKKTDPTGADGVVFVDNLLPGEYTIQENLESGWVNISPASQSVELLPGETKEVKPFVNAPLIGLKIVKFSDENKNGRRDPGENGLSGWSFAVVGPGGKKTIVGPTDNDGIVLVEGLIPGIYELSEVTRVIESDDRRNCTGGWICTTKNPQSIKITRSETAPTIEFGNKVNSLIIQKFNDSNLNKKQDGGEKGLPNWQFNIMGPDGRIFTTDPTNNDGITTVECLMPGRYEVSEIAQDGWINTTPLSVSVDVRAGEDTLVPAFGNIMSSRIELFKFNDTENFGNFDSNERGLPGWIFTIECPNGSVVVTRPTNAKGITSLERLTPGVYTVTENLVEGWINTTPLTKSINLGIGAEEKWSFGNYYCLPCHRFEKRMPPISTDGDIKVIKKVSNLSTENINRVSGNEVNYNITICPSRRIDEIASIPTDIVIAVDNSPSIINMRKSAVDGVRKLAEDIAANDKSHVTRIGLISWSDENNSGVEVPLIDNYTEVAAKASKITFAEGKSTKYDIGLDWSAKAFDEDSAGKEKKIVIITDASDNGYVKPRFADIDLSGYSIFAIVVGEKNETKALAMLNKLTSEHKGYVIPINDLSELGEALVKTATAGSLMKNVHLVEVLPNYLALDNSTATDDGGQVTLNGDSRDWTTTTIIWDIGDLSDCWSTDFRAVFCWKLPADANQPQRNSYVNYTDEKGMSRTLALPEHEINILSGTKREPVVTSTSAAKPEKEAPGFQGLLAAIGISLAGYLYRRREE